MVIGHHHRAQVRQKNSGTIYQFYRLYIDKIQEEEVRAQSKTANESTEIYLPKLH